MRCEQGYGSEKTIESDEREKIRLIGLETGVGFIWSQYAHCPQIAVGFVSFFFN